jgi:ADP-ribose pyrophosphatase YjhB (NUDIX family)
MSSDTPWLQWAQRLQAIAQTGLTYSEGHYDRERYEEIHKIAVEILAAQTAAPFARIEELFRNQTGYPTPKVDVRCAVFRDNKILLVKEQEDGKWTLPGGWADILDAPSEAAAREVWEEAGFHVHITRLLAVYDRAKHPHVPPFPFHIYKHFFLGEIIDGKPTPSPETTAVDFFARNEIPELSVSRVLPEQIERLFQLRDSPNAPTDFD